MSREIPLVQQVYVVAEPSARGGGFYNTEEEAWAAIANRCVNRAMRRFPRAFENADKNVRRRGRAVRLLKILDGREGR